MAVGVRATPEYAPQQESRSYPLWLTQRAGINNIGVAVLLQYEAKNQRQCQPSASFSPAIRASVISSVSPVASTLVKNKIQTTNTVIFLIKCRYFPVNLCWWCLVLKAHYCSLCCSLKIYSTFCKTSLIIIPSI